MSNPDPADAGVLWRSQGAEQPAINTAAFIGLRTRDLRLSTRADVLGSIAAAVFLLLVVTLRFGMPATPLARLVFAAGAVWMAAVILASLRERKPAAGFASDCLTHYRRELTLRRDHLRRSWLWHGPVVLACLFLFAQAGWPPAATRAWPAALLTGVLTICVAVGVARRQREAARLQLEIDELDRLP